MSEKIDAALRKLTEEAEELSSGDPCKLLISEYLMDRIVDDSTAELILAEDKTLPDLNQKMWDAAKKRKTGNGAHITDAELCEMADDYYGLAAAAPVGRAPFIDVADLL
jgi:hypothetical protein